MPLALLQKAVCWLAISSFFFCLMQNKSAFLCGVMKTYRQREKQGSKVQDSNKGPDEAKIKVNGILMLVISVNRMCSPSQVLCICLLSVFRHCWSEQDTPWMSPQVKENMEVLHQMMCLKGHSQGSEPRCVRFFSLCK